MFSILKKELFSPTTFLWKVRAPEIAAAAQPGQFVIIRLREGGERIPLTIADFDRERGTIAMVVKIVGATTQEMATFPEGENFLDLVGPLGLPTEIMPLPHVVFVGGGLGVAPIYPILRRFKEIGSNTTTIIGFRKSLEVFWEERFREFSDRLIVMTEDGSHGRRGTTTDVLRELLTGENPIYRILTVGPLPMMQAVAELSRPFKIPTIASMNPIMVDGIGMCGSCRVNVDGKVLFACVDGPDMDAHKIDFEEIKTRQTRFRREETASLRKAPCPLKLVETPPRPSPIPPRPSPQRKGPKIQPRRIPMREVEADQRRQDFGEVSRGYPTDLAFLEADRCLICKKPLCVQGCPVGIDIPGFIKKLSEGDLPGAYAVLKETNPLPAVCGRVCPQEIYCESRCVVAKKGDAISIGALERFVGDWGLQETVAPSTIRPAGKRAAIVGSGPAGIACAQVLAQAGVAVTIFEALHEAGGVLAYGIPPFRLPRQIVAEEIKKLRALGVRIEHNQVIGKVLTIEQLKKKGFDAVFIGTGAGLPKFMGIPGEGLNGVMSANEFLTRANLMRGFEGSETPVGLGKLVTVIGAGNTAIDAARTALRMGAEKVSIIYRRTLSESPARVEELRHATEEGIEFRCLTNPVRLVGDENGQVTEMVCVRMELGEPDPSGRRSPRPLAGSEFRIPTDTVIYALGTVANPIIGRSTPGLKTNASGYIEVDPKTQMTSLPGVFAGGDITTGGATVILALRAGKSAARGMLDYLGLKKGGGHGLALFYHRLSEAIDDPELADFFDNLSQMEQGHAHELDQKYHLHLSLEELFKDSGLPLRQPFFEDLCFLANRDDLHRLFDCAINLEKKTHNYFVAKVKEFPEGVEKELYKELAAEELDHISLLESMRDRRKRSSQIC